MKTQASRQRGITLIESCMVLAIGSILATSAVPGMQDMVSARRLDNTANALANDIHLTRTAAITRNQSLRMSFVPTANGSCYVIHTGSAGNCVCNGSGPAVCQGDAREIKTVTVTATEQVGIVSNVGSVLFDPMHGTSTPTGTLRIVGAGGREVRHIINVTGRVRSCSPAPVVPGYKAC